MKKRIVVLAGDVPSTPILVHALERDHEVCRVVIEDKEPRSLFLRRRAKRMGWWRVAGQVFFAALIVPIENVIARRRIGEIYTEYGFDAADIEPSRVVRVHSVNDAEVVDLLEREHPDVVVLHGTRIVSKQVLSAAEVPFVNIHAGITPMYRGVHGGYWSLADGHPEMCGVTVHLVDAGIDTGGVLAQRICVPTRADMFVTYPLVQLGEGIRALRNILASDHIEAQSVAASFSKVWYHPTIWGYLATYFRRGVK